MWRLRLIDNLEILSRQLWQIGVREIFADGSFAEDNDHPNDIDGYFECSLDAIRTGELTRELNRIDPFKVNRSRYAGGKLRWDDSFTSMLSGRADGSLRRA